jgi:hypothetical protein
MILDADRETVLVSGRRLFGVRVAPIDPPRSVRVTVVLDGRFEWTFDQAGWRPLAVGVGESGTFLWSARELITLPVDADGTPVVEFVADEDLLAVFEGGGAWVFVCETSVRRVIGRRETGRLEFDAVIESCWWVSDDEIVLRFDDGSERRFSFPGVGLEG